MQGETLRSDQGKPADNHQKNDLLRRLASAEASIRSLLVHRIEAQKARAALTASEARYQRMVERLPALVFELDCSGRLFFINEALSRVTGYQIDELREQDWQELLFPGESGRQIDALYEQMKSGDVTGYELEMAAKDGHRIIMSLNSANEYGPDGSLEKIVGLAIDITERKTAEEALQKVNEALEERVGERTAELQAANHLLALSNQRLKTVLQTQPAGVWIIDADGRMVEKNRLADTIWGGSAPLVENIDDLSLYQGRWASSGESLEGEDWALARALKGETSIGEVIDIQRFDGTRGTILNSAAPIYDEQNQLLGAVGVFHDITRQRELERQLETTVAEAEQRATELDAIYDAMTDAVILYDRQGKLLRANPIATRTFGFIPIYLNKSSSRKLSIHHPDGKAVRQEELPTTRAFQGEKVSGSPFIFTDERGREFHVLGSASPLYMGGKLTGVVAIWHDVTERERLLAQVEQERDKLHTLIESITDEVWFCDANGDLVLVNSAVLKNLGIRQADALHQPLAKVMQNFEICNSDGSKRPPEEAAMLRSLKGKSLQGEELLHKKSSGEVVYRQYSSAPIRSETGEILGAVSVVRNITQQKRAEEALRQARDELEVRVRERTLELARTNAELVAEVSERKRAQVELAEVQRRLMDSVEKERLLLARELHDGPMQDIYALTYRLAAVQDSTSPEEIEQELFEIREKLAEINSVLRSTAQDLRPPTLAPFGLEKAIRNHVEAFQQKYPGLEITLDLMEDGQCLSQNVRLALFRIYQVALVNVIRHAKASRVEIRLDIDHEQVVMEIEDNGIGFTVPKRWIGFAREGHLGLIGAFERAEAVGGKMEVHSEPGNGTLLRVIIPCSFGEDC